MMDTGVLSSGLFVSFILVFFIVMVIILFKGFGRKRKAPPLSRKDWIIHMKYTFAYSALYVLLYVLLMYPFFFGVGLVVGLFSLVSGFPITDGTWEIVSLIAQISLAFIMLIPFYYLMKAALRAVDKEATFLNRKSICVYFLVLSQFLGWIFGIFYLLLTNAFTLDAVSDLFRIGFIPIFITIYLSKKYKPLNR